MSTRSRDRALAHCASRAQKQTRLCKMRASLSAIMWSAPFSLLLKMDPLRRLCGVDLVRRRSAAACVHSEIMDSAALVGEDRVAVIAVALLLFRLATGSEARDSRRVADGMVVAEDGRHTETGKGSIEDRYQEVVCAEDHDTRFSAMYDYVFTINQTGNDLIYVHCKWHEAIRGQTEGNQCGICL